MNILYVNLLFCVFVGIITYMGNIDICIKNRIFMFISFILLVFFHSFINIESLPDLPSYNYSYNILKNTPIGDIGKVDVDAKLEIGFQFYMKFVSLLGFDFQGFLLVNSIILLALYYSVIAKYSSYVFVSVLILLLGGYNQSIFVLRQHLAMGLIFFSISYILDGRFYKYMLFCFLAFLFHQTAIIFVPIYLLYHIRSKKVMIGTLLVVLIAIPILFSLVIHYIGLNILHGYDSYLDSDGIGANIVGCVIALCFFGYYTFFLRSNVLERGINRLLFIILFINCIGSFAGIGFNPTNRLFMYYGMFNILAIPRAMQYISSPIVRMGTFLIIISFELYIYMYGSGAKYVENIEFIFS